MGGDGASVYVFGNNGAINGNYHQGVKIEAGQSFTTAGVGVYEVTEVPDQLNPPSGAILGLMENFMQFLWEITVGTGLIIFLIRPAT